MLERKDEILIVIRLNRATEDSYTSSLPVAIRSVRPEPFVEGMKITTGNSTANVQVRAKPLAVGVCGVKFSTAGGNAQFLAPPQVWSPWTNLVSHVGSVDLTISSEVVCDVGVIAEVRYHK